MSSISIDSEGAPRLHIIIAEKEFEPCHRRYPSTEPLRGAAAPRPRHVFLPHAPGLRRNLYARSRPLHRCMPTGCRRSAFIPDCRTTVAVRKEEVAHDLGYHRKDDRDGYYESFRFPARQLLQFVAQGSRETSMQRRALAPRKSVGETARLARLWRG